MRFWWDFIAQFIVAFVTITAMAGAGLAKERLVMPYQCGVTGGTLQLKPALAPVSHAILGPRDQRPFTACVDGEGPDCRTLMVHQFDMSCGGHRVSWVDVAAAMGDEHESAPKLVNGRLNMILNTRRRGSEKLPWQNGPDRARVMLPAGYAPVGEIGARFVLPNETGTVIVSPESTSVDAYASASQNAQLFQVSTIDGTDTANAAPDPMFGSSDDELGYAVATSGQKLETAALGTNHMSSWKTVVKSSDNGPPRESGSTFLSFMMFAGILASLVLAGGYGLRRRMVPEISMSGRRPFSFLSGSGQSFRATIQEATIAGAHGSNNSSADQSDRFDGEQWQPRQSLSTWSAVMESTLVHVRDAWSILVLHARQTFERVAMKVSNLYHDGIRQAHTARQSNGYDRPRHQWSSHETGSSYFHDSGFDADETDSTGDQGGYRHSQETQFRTGLNVVDIGLRYSEEAVSALEPMTPLHDVLTVELKTLRQRQAVLRATINDGSATPSRAEATMRRLTCELERIRRIADSAAETHGGGSGSGVQVPQTPAEAYAVLGVNADVTDVALKKIVDGMRMTWHPDMARDHADRAIREDRTKQLNIAWDVIQRDRSSEF